MISAARFPYLSIRAAAARARSRLGGSCESHAMQLLALVMAAAMGCLISCASDADISPNVLTRLTWARSASSCRSLSRSCSARLRIGNVLECTEHIGWVGPRCPASHDLGYRRYALLVLSRDLQESKAKLEEAQVSPTSATGNGT